MSELEEEFHKESALQSHPKVEWEDQLNDDDNGGHLEDKEDDGPTGQKAV